jgi:ankyrin repeat protein
MALVKLLVERGRSADCKAKDNNDLTPLWFAAQNRHEGMLKFLSDNDTEYEGSIYDL